MHKDFLHRLERIDKLPTLPLVIRKLDESVRDPESDIREVTGIIKDDPAIMARILKVANSVFYTTEKRISDLRTAVVVMGLRAVHNIALSTAVFSTFPPNKGTKMDRTAFWKHSIYTAVIAEILYSFSAWDENSAYHPEDLHLAGLLHDIGKIVLEQFFHPDFSQALELSHNQGVSLHVAENRILGTDHAQVGAWLGSKWNLSPEVLEAVRWHHHPEKAELRYSHLVGLCHVANHLANEEGLGNGGDYASHISETAFFDIGVSPDNVQDIVEKTRLESDKSWILLEMMAQEDKEGAV